MRSRLARHVARGAVPGLVAVVRSGEEQRTVVLGHQALDAPTPMSEGTIFRISSLTKPVVAVAALQLVEDGQICLDEPVDRWLPELAGRRVLRGVESDLDDTVPAARPITVRDLLTFRLGFGIVMAEPGTYPIQRATDELLLGQGRPLPQVPPPPDEWIRRFGTLPLIHQPGEQWMYNTGSDVLGVLIRRIAGRPLEQFLRERLFVPLGMTDTRFSVPADRIGRFATSYLSRPDARGLDVYDRAEDGQWSRPPRPSRRARAASSRPRATSSPSPGCFSVAERSGMSGCSPSGASRR